MEELKNTNVPANNVIPNLFKNIITSTDDLQKTIALVTKVMQHLIEETPPTLRILAKYGWYAQFSSIPRDIFEYAEALKEGKVDLVNEELTKVFEQDCEDIISRLCIEYLERKIILLEAKRAHINGMYFSSTSLFLSSADGIVEGTLYNKGGALKKYLQLEGIKIDIFNQFLTEEDAIKADYPREKGKFGSPLSRHGVLHGRDVEYGTKINSLKALSLLDYVAMFVTRNKDLS
jgi:hypothetical protein